MDGCVSVDTQWISVQRLGLRERVGAVPSVNPVQTVRVREREAGARLRLATRVEGMDKFG
jgi:hypothetical protein